MFRIIFFIVSAAVLYLSLMPTGSSAAPFPHFDKVAHFGVFAVLGALLARAYPSMRLLRVIALLALYGALIELLQHLTSYRTASLADFAADVASTAAGSMLLRKLFGKTA